jgi:hypothetical protein
MLPETYLLDAHLIPQSRATSYSYQGTTVPINFNGILKIEDEKHMLFIKDDLQIDTTIKENVTRSADIPIQWSPQTRKMVNCLYQSDFEKLGYGMLTT